jgi:hypothetical protein
MIIRAFDLDLAQWALDDPARWGPWAVPCPIRASDIQYKKQKSRTKARMDAQTRERLPVLPALAAAADRARTDAAARLEAARAAGPGELFTAAGSSSAAPAPKSPPPAPGPRTPALAPAATCENSPAPAANAASSNCQPASPQAPPSASATPSPASTTTTPPGYSPPSGTQPENDPGTTDAADHSQFSYGS